MQFSPGQLLTQIRSHYRDRLRQAIGDFVSDGIVTMISEGVLRKPDGSPATRGEPPLPARVDLITLVDGKVRDGLTIESDSMPSFPPFELRWEHTLPVRVGPFPWNACDVRMPTADLDWSPLVEWFESAFDVDEYLKPGEDGLIGVVHTLTQLPSNDGVTVLQIDFGSADVDAFEGMLDALKQMGVASVAVGKLTPPVAPTITLP